MNNILVHFFTFDFLYNFLYNIVMNIIFTKLLPLFTKVNKPTNLIGFIRVYVSMFHSIFNIQIKYGKF